MKNKYWLFFLVCLCININLSHGQGYKFVKEDSKKIRSLDLKSFGFSKISPPTYSLRKYAPIPQQQKGQTCVGWSLGYAALSISYNKMFKITEPNLKEILAFDPVFTYALSKGEERTTCDSATSFYFTIKQMLASGCKRLIMPPSFMDCEDNVYHYTDAFSAPFKPSDVFSLNLADFKSNEEKVKFLKSVLSDGKPLTIGMNTPKSFAGDRGSENTLSSGLWIPKKDEEFLGGHAMCLIGYNDTKFGGAFEIMNSWGKDYGDGGFIWIKYSDFFKYIYEIILVEVNDPATGLCKIGDCNNGYSVLKLESGTVYEGIMVKSRPEDFGVIIWPNKDFYAGGWKEGKRHGKGLFFNESEVYKVEYNEDELVFSESFGFVPASEKANSSYSKMEKLITDMGLKINQTPNPKIIKTLKSKKSEF
jgi:hypothetical protein